VGPHCVGVERTPKMVNLVRPQACRGTLENGEAELAVEWLVLDLDLQRTFDHATNVEEAQAALILFVCSVGRCGDPTATCPN
jgi:hypothetical protein